MPHLGWYIHSSAYNVYPGRSTDVKLTPDSPASYSRIWGWWIWCQLHVGGRSAVMIQTLEPDIRSFRVVSCDACGRLVWRLRSSHGAHCEWKRCGIMIAYILLLSTALCKVQKINTANYFPLFWFLSWEHFNSSLTDRVNFGHRIICCHLHQSYLKLLTKVSTIYWVLKYIHCIGFISMIYDFHDICIYSC